MKKSIILFFVLTVHLSAHIDGLAPPGMNKIPGMTNIYLDKTEVTNSDWLEYVSSIKQQHQEDSDIYKRALPDSSVWQSAYKTSFEKPGIYAHYPVVGVNFPQVLSYCAWKSEAMSKRRKRAIVYSLPSYEEFYKASHGNEQSPAAGLYSTNFTHRRSFIGICDNAAEMTNIEGLAINGFWGEECLDSLRYRNMDKRLSFRCKASFKK